MGQKSTILAVGLIIFAVILVILFIISRVIGSPRSEQNRVETTTQQSAENLVPVSKIINDPVVYNGYNLSVETQISGWTTNKSFYFSAQDTGLLGGGARGLLLAIAGEPYKLPQDSDDDKLGLGENAQVIAKGTIRILNKEELQTALGVNLEDPKVTLNNDVIANWSLGPVLMLDSVEVTSSK